MIKFFRHIRQRLLSENKFSEYLLYAIGEIVLVVIGILIALGINSEYNDAQNEKKIEAILTQVQHEILIDIPKAEEIFNFYIQKDSLARRIIDDSITIELFQEDLFNVLINFQYVVFSNKREGYERLMQNLENLPQRYNYLLPFLNRIYIERQKEVDNANAIIKENVMNPNNSHWVREPMATDYLIGRYPEAAADYFVNDPFLKNRTGRYINNLRNISKAANDYRIACMELYVKIDSLQGKQRLDYPEELMVLPNKNSVASYVGDYERVGGTLIRGEAKDFSLAIEEDHVMINGWSGHTRKLYWANEGYYYGKGNKGIYQMYTNDNGQHALEWSNGFVNLLFVLKKDQ